ncbi:unannotated protein [freshwater metagenome]|uniref:Unannotated protein n=1 Tax=freshwater metagenome TaxID=449393 RepID=A0A6J7AK25_9ZZZZ
MCPEVPLVNQITFTRSRAAHVTNGSSASANTLQAGDKVASADFHFAATTRTSESLSS